MRIFAVPKDNIPHFSANVHSKEGRKLRGVLTYILFILQDALTDEEKWADFPSKHCNITFTPHNSKFVNQDILSTYIKALFMPKGR